MTTRALVVGMACLALLFFWGLGAHNRLMRLRTAIGKAFAQLDPLLAERLAWIESVLVPMLAGGAGAAPAPQAPAWSRLMAARDQFALALASVRGQPADAGAMRRLLLADSVLQGVWAELLGALPGVDEPFPGRAEWRSALDRLRHQERPLVAAFNEAVARYNRAAAQFPAVLLAQAFGFSAAAPMAAPGAPT